MSYWLIVTVAYHIAQSRHHKNGCSAFCRFAIDKAILSSLALQGVLRRCDRAIGCCRIPLDSDTNINHHIIALEWDGDPDRCRWTLRSIALDPKNICLKALHFIAWFESLSMCFDVLSSCSSLFLLRISQLVKTTDCDNKIIRNALPRALIDRSNYELSKYSHNRTHTHTRTTAFVHTYFIEATTFALIKSRILWALRFNHLNQVVATSGLELGQLLNFGGIPTGRTAPLKRGTNNRLYSLVFVASSHRGVLLQT